MYRVIQPRGRIAWIYTVLGILGLGLLISNCVADYTLEHSEVIATVQCRAISNSIETEVASGNNYVVLKTLCGESEDPLTMYNPETIVSWVNNPGPITCRMHKAGNYSCDPRPAE